MSTRSFHFIPVPLESPFGPVAAPLTSSSVNVTSQTTSVNTFKPLKFDELYSPRSRLRLIYKSEKLYWRTRDRVEHCFYEDRESKTMIITNRSVETQELFRTIFVDLELLYSELEAKANGGVKQTFYKKKDLLLSDDKDLLKAASDYLFSRINIPEKLLPWPVFDNQNRLIPFDENEAISTSEMSDEKPQVEAGNEVDPSINHPILYKYCVLSKFFGDSYQSLEIAPPLTLDLNGFENVFLGPMASSPVKESPDEAIGKNEKTPKSKKNHHSTNNTPNNTNTNNVNVTVATNNNASDQSEKEKITDKPVEKALERTQSELGSISPRQQSNNRLNLPPISPTSASVVPITAANDITLNSPIVSPTSVKSSQVNPAAPLKSASSKRLTVVIPTDSDGNKLPSLPSRKNATMISPSSTSSKIAPAAIGMLTPSQSSSKLDVKSPKSIISAKMSMKAKDNMVAKRI